jgi:hypothetical protein
MKRAVPALLIMLSSLVVLAADVDEQKKDYSRPTILRILHDQEVEQPPFKIDVGMLEVNTRSTHYRMAWLPFLAPLPYSYPRQTMEVPNPFVLTGTDIPYVPPPQPQPTPNSH